MALPRTGQALGPTYLMSSAKQDAVYESAVAYIRQQVLAGSMGGFYRGFAGLALLGHPEWNTTQRAAINQLRDDAVAAVNASDEAPTETYLYNGQVLPDDKRRRNGFSNWQLGTTTMFLAEYYARTYQTDPVATRDAVVAALQGALVRSANSIQWWKQPALTYWSPSSTQSAGTVGHGGVEGDYVHLGWAMGINACGTLTFQGMVFGMRAAQLTGDSRINLNARPRDGHYFGYTDAEFDALRADANSGLSLSRERVGGVVSDVRGFHVVEPGNLFTSDTTDTSTYQPGGQGRTSRKVYSAGWNPSLGEHFDPSIREKFLLKMKWLALANTGGGYESDEQHVGYCPGSWTISENVGKTSGTIHGMELYKMAGGTLDAAEEDILGKMKNYVARQYFRQQDAHAYCVGAQAQWVLGLPFLSDRQVQYALENWAFFYNLSRTHGDGFEYVPARYTDDNYLNTRHCAAFHLALPRAVARGAFTLMPGIRRNRIAVHFQNPDMRWPDPAARFLAAKSRTVPMPVGVMDGNGAVLDPSQYSLSWQKVSGAGSVTFGNGQLVFSMDGNYRLNLTVTSGSMVLQEPIDVSVATASAPAGHVLGGALYEVFKDIPGSAVVDLTRHWKFPAFPDETRVATSLEGTFSGNLYGARLSGVIVAPATGTYRFYLAADDAAELRVNTGGLDGAAGVLMASVATWTAARDFLAVASQRSVEVTLAEGQAVGFEALHKEASGGDHVAVGWSINGGPIEVIPGQLLARPAAVVPSMAILTEPVAVRGTLGGTVTLSFTTQGPSPAMYQWRRNGQPVGAIATTPSLTLSNLSAGSEGDYSCVYTTLTGTLTTRTVRVSVVDAGNVVAGALWQEVYTGIGGETVEDLTSHSKFPNGADQSGPLTSLSTGTLGNNYGQRWTGWITPPTTGNYRFYIAADDAAEVWLGTDETVGSAAKILSRTTWTNAKQWSATSPSAYLPLAAGQRYYIEVRHKEGGGGDHCAVAWQREGTAAPANGSGEIPGSVLSYRSGGLFADSLLFNVAPTFDPAVMEGRLAFAGAAYSDGVLATSVMDRNSIDLPALAFSKVSGPAWLQVAANGTVSGTPAAGDVGVNEFTVRATDPGGLSGTATLRVTVRPANTPPVFASNPVLGAGALAHVHYTGQTLAGTASDADAWDALTFSKVSGPAWLSVAANGALSGAPAFADAGTNAFVVRVTDLAGASASTTLRVVVSPVRARLAVNDVLVGSTTLTGFNKGDTLTLSANIERGFGVITGVEFLVGNTVVGSDSTVPYAVAWANAPAGTHVVTARVLTSTAHGVQVLDAGTGYVEEPPVVTTRTYVATDAMAAGKVLGSASATPGAGRSIASWTLLNETARFAIDNNGAVRLTQAGGLAAGAVVTLRVRATDNAGVDGEGGVNILCNPPVAGGITEQRWAGSAAYDGQDWTSAPPAYTARCRATRQQWASATTTAAASRAASRLPRPASTRSGSRRTTTRACT